VSIGSLHGRPAALVAMPASSTSDVRPKAVMQSGDHLCVCRPDLRATVVEACRVDLACTAASAPVGQRADRPGQNPGRSWGSHVYVFGAEGRPPAEPLPDVTEIVAWLAERRTTSRAWST
jgi:hypothetical protein